MGSAVPTTADLIRSKQQTLGCGDSHVFLASENDIDDDDMNLFKHRDSLLAVLVRK